MGEKKAIKGKLKEFKILVNSDFPDARLILFGSRARGKVNKWSDVDLIIVSKKFSKFDFFQRGAKMYDYWKFLMPVDFLCYTPEEFNKLKNQVTIVREAVENGIEIK